METQNNNFNDLNELDDLRSQINDLKNKVNQQGHLNEELVKKAIQSKMKGVHRTIIMFGLMAIAVIPLYILMKFEDGFSWPFTIFTIIFLLGCVVMDYFVNRMDVSHMGDDMVETARKLTLMKKNRKKSQTIGFGVAIVWLAWFCYEFYITHLEMMDSRYAITVVIFMFCIAITVGALSGYMVYRKMQRANDEMIDQINEFVGQH